MGVAWVLSSRGVAWVWPGLSQWRCGLGVYPTGGVAWTLNNRGVSWVWSGLSIMEVWSGCGLGYPSGGVVNSRCGLHLSVPLTPPFRWGEVFVWRATTVDSCRGQTH